MAIGFRPSTQRHEFFLHIPQPLLHATPRIVLRDHARKLLLEVEDLLLLLRKVIDEALRLALLVA